MLVMPYVCIHPARGVDALPRCEPHSTVRMLCAHISYIIVSVMPAYAFTQQRGVYVFVGVNLIIYAMCACVVYVCVRAPV